MIIRDFIKRLVKRSQLDKMSNGLRLEQLFSRCDTSGSGLIDSDDFQDLCAGFGIEEVLVNCIQTIIVSERLCDHQRKSPNFFFRETVTSSLLTWTTMEMERSISRISHLAFVTF